MAETHEAVLVRDSSLTFDEGSLEPLVGCAVSAEIGGPPTGTIRRAWAENDGHTVKAEVDTHVHLEIAQHGGDEQSTTISPRKAYADLDHYDRAQDARADARYGAMLGEGE